MVESITRRRQHGFAAVAVLLLVILALIGVVLAAASRVTASQARDRISDEALTAAREALIDYAVSRPLSSTTRLGELPCPDLDNDGVAESNCTLAGQRVGRFPWKTLGVPELRDGYGERLWYAVSDRFRQGDATTLNSDTRGQITYRAANGTVSYDASASSGAIAVLVAPGPVLTRLGATAPQDRSCAGDSNVAQCESTGVCSGVSTPRCTALNYLDRVDNTVVPSLSVAEDNQDFSDGSPTDGFIAGPIYDAGRQTVVNDRILTLGSTDLMPRLEQRVAGEVLDCLTAYASANGGLYPFTASSSDTLNYADVTDTFFGRVPDTLSQTKASNNVMSDTWPAGCPVYYVSFWNAWKSQVFFAVGSGFRPSPGTPGSCPTGCFSVSPVSRSPDKQVVVLVAGTTLLGQNRSSTSAAADQYLEGGNPVGLTSGIFAKDLASASFNDTVAYR